MECIEGDAERQGDAWNGQTKVRETQENVEVKHEKGQIFEDRKNQEVASRAVGEQAEAMLAFGSVDSYGKDEICADRCHKDEYEDRL